jgi:hypothetical protein
MTRRTRSGEHAYRQVEVSVLEANGAKHQGELALDANWVPPPNGGIQVRYTPDGRMRPAGQVNWIGIGMFVIAMCVVLFLAIRLFLQARAATRYLAGSHG